MWTQSHRSRRRSWVAAVVLLILVVAACATAPASPTAAPAKSTTAAAAPTQAPAAAQQTAPVPTTAQAQPAAVSKPAYVPVRMVLPQSFLVADIAIEMGFYKEAGLQVTKIPAASLGVGMVQAVVQGVAETSSPTMLPALLVSRANGAPMEATLNGYTSQPGPFQTWRFYVKKDSPIKNPEDIKGKRIGLPGLGSGADFVLMAYLQKHGFKNDDVRRVVVPTMQLQSALQTDQVDVISLYDILYTKIDREGWARVFFSDLDSGAPTATLSNAHSWSKDFIAKHPETVKAVTNVDRKTQQWVLDNPEKAKQIVAKVTGFVAEDLLIPAFRPPSCLSAADADAWSAILSKVYKEVKPTDGAEMIRNDLNSACPAR